MGQDDIIVGILFVGRNYFDIEGIVGMFVNMFVICSEVKQDEMFIYLIICVCKQVLDVFFYQDYLFEWFVEDLNILCDVSRYLLFDMMFSF